MPDKLKPCPFCGQNVTMMKYHYAMRERVKRHIDTRPNALVVYRLR